MTGPDDNHEDGVTEVPVHLDDHRSATGRVEAETRRDLLAEIRSGQAAERRRRQAMEEKLFAHPAATWAEAAAKAEYLLLLLAEMPDALPPARRQLVTHALDDLARLAREERAGGGADESNAHEPGPTNQTGESE